MFKKFTPRLIPLANGSYVRVSWWKRKFNLYHVYHDYYQTEGGIFYQVFLRMSGEGFLIIEVNAKNYYKVKETTDKLKGALKW